MWFFTMDRTVINCLGENTEKCKNRNKQSNKELLGIKTKLWYNKIFFRKFISYRYEKTRILMNKPVCLGLSIL